MVLALSGRVLHVNPLVRGLDFGAGDFDGALCSHESIKSALASGWAFAAANTPILLQYVGTGITAAFACHLGAVIPTATLPGVTASHAYESDLIVTPHKVQRGFMKVPEGPGLGVTLDEAAVKRYSETPEPTWKRHISVVTLPGGIKHYYRNLQQAERLMKQGVDESYAPGVRLEEWEDDGSETFDQHYSSSYRRATGPCGKLRTGLTQHPLLASLKPRQRCGTGLLRYSWEIA